MSPLETRVHVSMAGALVQGEEELVTELELVVLSEGWASSHSNGAGSTNGTAEVLLRAERGP